MKGYTKTITGGTEDCLILGVREAYVRETSLPLNWTRCRIGMFISGTLDTDDNAAYANATTPYNDVLDQISIGISNGVGTVGQAGNRFVGMGKSATAVVLPYVNGTSHSVLGINAALADNTTIGDGKTVVLSTGSGMVISSVGTPAGESNYAQFLLLDITLNPTNCVITRAHLGNPTNITSAGLRKLINETVVGNSATATGGWWNGTAVGMRHLHIRYPAYFARLRIHAVEVVQLA